MSTHSVTTVAPAAAHTRTPGEVVRLAAVTAGVAVVANLSALLVGRILGAEMVLGATGDNLQTVGVLQVVAATLIGLLAGTLLLLVVRNRGHRAWTAVALAGVVVGIATIPAPLSMTAEGATQATLASMHVVTGLVWFVLVRRGARS